MTQNIYDTAEFFEGYSQMARSVHGLDGAPEWPALQALIPALAGSRVVDLGCGFGWFCRWAEAQGAAQVLGLDVSQNMLDRARATTPAGRITYQRADLENLTLPAAAYDLAYSSLTLHYEIFSFTKPACAIYLVVGKIHPSTQYKQQPQQAVQATPRKHRCRRSQKYSRTIFLIGPFYLSPYLSISR